MAILTGAMTARRFRVVGDVPEGFRDIYRQRLQEYAYIEPPQGVGKEEHEGWVQAHNLLDADFENFDRWLYNQYLLFALRVDKKSLPRALFNATVAKRCEAWCEESGVERCPRSIKTQIKEELEDEWLKRALPRVAVTEAVWNLTDGYLLLHSMSETVADRFRKRFHQTFGLQLAPWSPLDWMEDGSEVDALMATTPARLTGGEA